ncbi:hypothetical protein ACIPSA_42085 [Streptomyces sp. NPDC086549]|uniref:hypothetical protein n=1 Tax=Streptomyces sp. NPDC086549 TaxID=3365752 RepID=UPI003811095E
MTHTEEDEEDKGGKEEREGMEEDLLRAALAQGTPSGSNPRRVQEIRRRVAVARRRRRMVMGGAAVLAVAAAVIAYIRVPLPCGERTAAAPGSSSWAPPGFTDLRTSDLTAAPSTGWHTVLRPNAYPGTRVVATYSPHPTSASPASLSDG